MERNPGTPIGREMLGTRWSPRRLQSRLGNRRDSHIADRYHSRRAGGKRPPINPDCQLGSGTNSMIPMESNGRYAFVGLPELRRRNSDILIERARVFTLLKQNPNINAARILRPQPNSAAERGIRGHTYPPVLHRPEAGFFY